MPGIYVAALISSVFALAIAAWILSRAPEWLRLPLALLFLLELPMEPLSFPLLREPLDALLRLGLDPHAPAYGLARMFYAPLTEEPAKLWLLLLPWFDRRYKTSDAVWWALAMGFGFGIGEMWKVASLIEQGNPAVAHMPWYQLTGYIGERLMVCAAHSGFALGTLLLVPRLKPAALLGGMGLHYAANFPLYLAAINFAGLGRGVWSVILALWVQVTVLAMILFLLQTHLKGAGISLRRAMDMARCPGCRLEYRRPFFGANLLHGRYERCPHCRKWHTAPWLWEIQPASAEPP